MVTGCWSVRRSSGAACTRSGCWITTTCCSTRFGAIVCRSTFTIRPPNPLIAARQAWVEDLVSVGYTFPTVTNAFDLEKEKAAADAAAKPKEASPTFRAVEAFRRESTLPCNETVYYQSYNPACTKHYVSVVSMTKFMGEDDAYMARLRRHVHLLAHKFNEFDISGEVIVVNYNSESKMSSVIERPESAGNVHIRFLNVKPETHEKFCNATEPRVDPKNHSLWEYYGKNIGIRRARGACRGDGAVGLWGFFRISAYQPLLEWLCDVYVHMTRGGGLDGLLTHQYHHRF